jgi:hypothetical protein
MSQPSSSRMPRFRLLTLAVLAATSLSACIVVPPNRHYSRGDGYGYGGPGRVWVEGYWQQSPRGRLWIEGHWSGR